jgi:hypothetical protein
MLIEKAVVIPEALLTAVLAGALAVERQAERATVEA